MRETRIRNRNPEYKMGIYQAYRYNLILGQKLRFVSFVLRKLKGKLWDECDKYKY